jgi:hypothetical protein
MLKTGSIILSIWSGINFLLAALILTSVVIFNANSPLLVMVFEKHEIASLDTRVIASLNTLTILYNSCSMVLSVLVWLIIRKNLNTGQKWAFWALLFVIGFVEVMALYRICRGWTRALAGERYFEHFIRCRHWSDRLCHLEAAKVRRNSESRYLRTVRPTGCTSVYLCQIL